MWPYQAADASEGAVSEFGDQQPRRIDRPRHRGDALGDALEADPAVIGLVPDQNDQPVALVPGPLERPLQQRLADAVLAERRFDGERAEQQCRCRANPDRPIRATNDRSRRCSMSSRMR